MEGGWEVTTPTPATPSPTLPLKGEGVKSREKKIGRRGLPYVPAESGDGVAFTFEKLKPAVERRIEELGVLNDRRVAYVAAGDGESLLQLADEYDKRKMPVMAETVRKEAYEFTGREQSKVAGRRSKVNSGD
jgi:hypothetical protein